MIEVVRFRNFKALRKVDVTLGRFTVLVGPNASGKTSVLDGLMYLAKLINWTSSSTEELHRIGLSDYTVEEAHSKGAPQNSMSLHLEGTWGGTRGGITTQRDRSVPERHLSSPPHIEAFWGDQKHHLHTQEGDISHNPFAEENERPSDIEPLCEAIPPPAMLRVDPTECARPSYSEERRPLIGRNGHGVASVIADMLTSRAEDVDVLVSHLRRVVPTLNGVRATRAQVNRQENQVVAIDGQKTAHTINRAYWGHEIEFDMVGGDRLRARLASEGTLVVLALLTALFNEPKPKLLLLDDLERALHPKAQAELIRCLRELLAARPDLQIVATSHSPYLLDHFDPSEVRLMAVDDEGNASCAALDEHPDFGRWKGIMTPGEFWSSVGEGWVKDAARAKHDASGALCSYRR